MPLDEDDFPPMIKRKRLPSRRLTPNMQRMLDYIERLGGTLPVNMIILLPNAGQRALAGLITRAYVRQDAECNVVMLPRDLDQRGFRQGAKLLIPDLDNL